MNAYQPQIDNLKETFIEQAQQRDASIECLSHKDQIESACQRFMEQHHIHAPYIRTAAALQSEISGPLFKFGPADQADTISLTPCLAAIAETGTLAVASSKQTPMTLYFLPENNIMLVKASQLVASYEQAWQQVKHNLPRNFTLISGPSRTADIEQYLLRGMHGPKRLHILLLEETHD